MPLFNAGLLCSNKKSVRGRPIKVPFGDAVKSCRCSCLGSSLYGCTVCQPVGFDCIEDVCGVVAVVITD